MAWEVKKLGEIAEIKGGKRVPKGYSLEFVQTNHPYIRVTDFNDDGTINLTDLRYVNDLIFDQIKNYTISKEDLYISIAGTIGKTGIVPNELDGANLTENACKLVFLKNIDKRFIYYFTKTDDFLVQAGLNTRTTTMAKLALTRLATIQIPIPSLNEQKHIVAILDEAFERIAKAKENAEKNLDNAKEVFESYLQNVFEKKGEGWEEKMLGEVCDTGAGGTPLKSHKEYYENGTIPWLRSGEVDKKDIISPEMLITPIGLKNSSARLFPKNTVLIAMYGATAGQVGILRFESSTNQAVCGILPNDKFIPEFLYYKFNAGKADLIKQAVGGAQPNISQIKIKNTFVPVLSISMQKSIVSKLDNLSQETKKLSEIYEKKLADLEELKKSILQKAFNGELIEASA